MIRALRLPTLDPMRLHAAFGAVAAAVRGAPGIEMAVANAKLDRVRFSTRAPRTARFMQPESAFWR